MQVEKLEAQEIVISHPESPIKITMTATKDGAGIWIGDGVRQVAIHSIVNQCCLALMDPRSANGHAFAVSIDDAGEVAMQVVDKAGKIVIADTAKLQGLLG